MGNGLGKDDKKKAPQVNKANSYPQTKRGRRQTIDGIPPHLNLEVTKKDKANKYSTGNFKDPKLQQQLAELKLGETIGKRPSRKSSAHSANGRDGSDHPQVILQEAVTRKKGNKLQFLHNSLKRNKTYP